LKPRQQEKPSRKADGISSQMDLITVEERMMDLITVYERMMDLIRAVERMKDLITVEERFQILSQSRK
jgi:hypothetical protein